MWRSKIPKLRNLNASHGVRSNKMASTQQSIPQPDPRRPIKRSTYKAIALDSVPEPVRVPPQPSSKASVAVTDQKQKHQSNQNRLLNFIQKQRESHGLGIDDNGNDIKSNRQNPNKKREEVSSSSNRTSVGGNVNGNKITASTRSTQSGIHKNTPTPCVPSKRMIQHHDYQNVPDDVASANKVANRKQPHNRKSNNGRAFISTANASNILYRDQQKQQFYRHFGDTNILRNNINKKSTSPYTDNTIDIRPQRYIKKSDQLQRKNSPLPFVACDMTNDTGFSSLGYGDTLASSAFASNLYSPYGGGSGENGNHRQQIHQMKCTNVDVKNRIKMFGVDLSSQHNRSSYHNNISNHNIASNINNNNQHQRRIMNVIDQRKLQIAHSASSSSNLSSSNSNSSDVNSLDSMEHETIHHKNVVRAHHPSNSEMLPHVTNRTNLLMNNVSRNNATGGDSMSYLGPFNFRQLLRPTQGPTNSLRKRKSFDLTLTPPPC